MKLCQLCDGKTTDARWFQVRKITLYRQMCVLTLIDIVFLEISTANALQLVDLLTQVESSDICIQVTEAYDKVMGFLGRA